MTTHFFRPILCVFLFGKTMMAYSQQSASPMIQEQRKALTGKPLVNFKKITDSVRLMKNLEVLSSDEMAGRLVGTEGNAKAKAFILAQLEATSVKSLQANWEQNFELQQKGEAITGTNIIGLITGTVKPDSFIVLSAHYDHLGTRNGNIYHGADDDASGVVTLIEAAHYFTKNPPRYSLVFCFFDAEESGLKGSFYFTDNLPKPLTTTNITLNINLDMVSRNHFGNELFACGTINNPMLKSIISPAQNQSNIALIFGHDGEPGSTPTDNWIMQSDQGAFYKKNISFLYLGVEDHPDYHKPTDTFEHIDKAFFYQSSNLILDIMLLVDRY